MGREIRKVPANWDHPKQEGWNDGRLQPMYDDNFSDDWEEWLANFDRIRSGNLTDLEKECYPRGLADWIQYESAPDPKYYRPWKDEEATWFQVWETVSEGTPVTPPFATKEELIDYLVDNGDLWDQHRDTGGWRRENAEKFVNAGWAPSFVVTRTAGALDVRAVRDGNSQP